MSTETSPVVSEVKLKGENGTSDGTKEVREVKKIERPKKTSMAPPASSG